MIGCASSAVGILLLVVTDSIPMAIMARLQVERRSPVELVGEELG